MCFGGVSSSSTTYVHGASENVPSPNTSESDTSLRFLYIEVSQNPSIDLCPENTNVDMILRQKTDHTCSYAHVPSGDQELDLQRNANKALH